MLFQTAEKFLSSARLIPYKAAANGDEQASLHLYLDNLRVAQSFYAPLSLLEVAFRNAMHDVLAAHFRSDNWLLTQRTGFMVDPKLTFFDRHKSESTTNDKVLKMVKAAIKEFKEQRGYDPVAGATLIADLSFGFWTTLFSGAYFFLLDKAPLKAFGRRPRGTDWKIIRDKLNEVRRFRNRVYHYEPLCFQKQPSNVLCFTHLDYMHDNILELLNWLDPALVAWVSEVDRVPDILQKARKKHPNAT